MSTRPRALSDPLHLHSYKCYKRQMDRLVAIGQRNRETSPLLRLPAELRNEIYKYVFYVEVIYPGPEMRTGHQWNYAKSDLSLLSTCHQIYAEAHLLPFTQNVFLGLTEHVLEMLFTSLPRMQAHRIPRVTLYADQFNIYDDGEIGPAGLSLCLVKELGWLSTLSGIRHLTLIWLDDGAETVCKVLHRQVSGVLESLERPDIVITVMAGSWQNVIGLPRKSSAQEQ